MRSTVTRILAFTAVLVNAVVSLPTKKETAAITDAQEFEAAHIGLIISPILTADVIREIEVYWSHECFRLGDSIAIYTEDPSEDAEPIFTFKPIGANGIQKTGIEANFVPVSSLTFERQCLGYHVAWLRDEKIMKTNCLETRPNWMADRREELASKRFRDIFLPGSHNSGSYVITEDPTAETLVAKYVICQDESVLAQLIYGVRYLDIRVGYYGGTDSSWWINHGVIKVVELQDVIDDVKTFLNNTNEIVIFDVQEFPVGFGTDLTVHRRLVAYLEEQFADYLLPKSYGWSTTLESIWASGRRLIIGYDESNVVPLYDTIWPCVTHQWGNVRTMSDLYFYLVSIETNARSASTIRPRSAMAQLTPNTWDILLDRFGGLRQMAEDININVTTWYNTEFPDTANIVAVDYFKSTGIVETAIEWNDKRFSNSSSTAYTCSKK
ncbi:PI-PLC X domain-containing protein 1-like [Athalia rosae]|uniref:PI-PLC X domain-containing protein 1-like n=1 Tax=Athalia rosae TaxID=37344 RepID=UPI0020347C14|nr:PI-PLC X domain-containing protein 1-like [Athalia rosae]